MQAALHNAGVDTVDSFLDWLWWLPLPSLSTTLNVMSCGHSAVEDFIDRLGRVHPEVCYSDGNPRSRRVIGQWVFDHNSDRQPAAAPSGSDEEDEEKDYGGFQQPNYTGSGRRLRDVERPAGAPRIQRAARTAANRAQRDFHLQPAYLRRQYAGYTLDSDARIISAGSAEAFRLARDGGDAGVIELLHLELARQAAVRHPAGSAAAAMAIRFAHAAQLLGLQQQLFDNRLPDGTLRAPEENFGTAVLRKELRDKQMRVVSLLKQEEKRVQHGYALPPRLRPVISPQHPTTQDQWNGEWKLDTYGLYAAACFERRHASIYYYVFVLDDKCAATVCLKPIEPWLTHAFMPALRASFGEEPSISFLVDAPHKYSNQYVVEGLVGTCVVHNNMAQCPDWRARCEEALPFR